MHIELYDILRNPIKDLIHPSTKDKIQTNYIDARTIEAGLAECALLEILNSEGEMTEANILNRHVKFLQPIIDNFVLFYKKPSWCLYELSPSSTAYHSKILPNTDTILRTPTGSIFIRHISMADSFCIKIKSHFSYYVLGAKQPSLLSPVKDFMNFDANQLALPSYPGKKLATILRRRNV